MHQVRIYDHVMACTNALTIVKRSFYSHGSLLVFIVFSLSLFDIFLTNPAFKDNVYMLCAALFMRKQL